MTNMDKLYEAVEARGPVCVGLDTDFSYLPADFVDSTLTKGENIAVFDSQWQLLPFLVGSSEKKIDESNSRRVL